MRQKKRTKRQYENLYDNPGAMFDGCDVVLFPNGENEIWIGSADGKHRLRIVAGRGNAGFSVTVSKFIGGVPLRIRAYDLEYNQKVTVGDGREVNVVSYDDNDFARDFSDWYDRDVQGRSNRPANPPNREDYDEYGMKRKPL